MWLGISHDSALVEAREKNVCARSFAQTAHVAAVEFYGSTGARESGLAGSNLVAAKIDRGQPGHSHRAGRNIAAAMGYFEAEAIDDLIAFHLMHLDQRRLLILIGDGPSRPNAGPIKNIQVVQASLRSQHLDFFHGSFGGQLRVLLNQGAPDSLFSMVYTLPCLTNLCTP